MPSSRRRDPKRPARTDDEDPTLRLRMKRLEEDMDAIWEMAQEAKESTVQLHAKVDALQTAAVSGASGMLGRLDELKHVVDQRVLPGLTVLLKEHEGAQTRWEKWRQRAKEAGWWLVRSAGQAVLVVLALQVYRWNPDLGKFVWPILAWLWGKVGL